MFSRLHSLAKIGPMMPMNQSTAPKRYIDADGHEIEIDHWSETHVSFFPQGGGFGMRMPVEDFKKRYQPAPDAPRPYAPIKVAFDWMDQNVSFDALSNGDRWNGWAKPYFTREVGLELCKIIPGLTYDEIRDSFKHEDDDGLAEDADYFDSVQILVDGKERSLYGIGWGCWTWDEAEPAEKPSAERAA